MKLGLIGAGRIGRLHGEVITYYIPNAEIKTVSDVFMNEGIKNWANHLGISNITTDYKEILSDPEIQAVLICSSTDTHAKFIIEAAKAGKHIFCEKPIDFNVEKINEALRTVNEAGVKLQIGFQRRFDHNFKRMKELIEEGKIGDIHIVKITSRDPAPPPVEYIRVSGGIFLDMMIHDFDMARYLSGSEVEEVYAQGSVLVDPAIGEAGDIDTAIVTLKFKNGAHGVIDNSRQAVYGYDQRVEVFGSKGCLTVENDFPNSVVLSTAENVVSDKPHYFFLERYMNAYVEEIKAFVNAIEEGKETPVVGNDGLQPVLIGLAAQKSLKEGRPVRIKEKFIL
ncbi:inositol 2-dehydrogenase [Desulfotomaculum nigrificans]|uniref:inositol 2-dehydrogenase n=1 Tax=Desulfotomaculum nigrificans TaxID=1565 RepID=UPI0001FAEC98|nr:inositol 2-dehydrogenase [Desulfotomaculum nigrificans]